MPPRMKEKLDDEVYDKIKEQFGIANPMALPKLQKIVINVGMGNALEGTKLNATARETVLKDLSAIAGQKPVTRKAKKSVSNFKIREGYEVGAMVTLRGNRMWEFLDRMVTLAIPRIKDFRGLSDKSFDKAGNYSFGVREQGIFPEVNMAEAQYTHGLNINVVLTNSDPEKSRFVLGEMGMPFVRPEDN